MATPSGGSIVVRIAGDDAQLQATLVRAQKGLGQLTSTMRVGANAAVKYGAALTALGAAAVTALVTNQMKAIDATAKFSDQIGIATKELTQLQFAARDAAGVTDQTFNMAMRRMTRRIAEAALGAGPAAKTIKELGLSAAELKDAGPAEALRRISDGLAKTTSHADRLRIAFTLFDTDGGALVPMLMQGSAALDEYAKKADALGVSFSRIEAAQVEAASDAMARIGDVITGVRNRLTIELAPYIEEVASRFTAFAVESGGFGKQVEEGVATALRALGALGDGIQGLRVVVKGLELIGTGAAAAFNSALQLVAEAVVATNDIIAKSINFAIRGLQRLGVSIDEIPLMDESEFMQSFRRFADESRNSVGDVRAELHELAMQEMPSDQIERFLTAVKERSQEAAEGVAAARAEMYGTDAEGGGEADPKARERLEANLKALEQYLSSEVELQRAAHAERQAQLQELLDGNYISEERYREMLAELDDKYKAERLGALDNYLASEEEKELAAHADRVARLAEEREEGLRTQDEYNRMLEELEAGHQARLTEIKRKEDEQRTRYTEQWADHEMSLRRGVVNDAVTLLQQFAGKSKVAAIAAIAVSKGLMIAETIMSTAAAQMRALAELGPIAGPPMAAKIGALGAVKVGLIAATGLAQAVGAGKGGGVGGVGAVGGVGGARDLPPGTAVAAPSKNTMVTINMSDEAMFSGKQVRGLIEQINEALDDGMRLRVAG